ncbi:hypothetical protein BKA66DRAFT_419427 [Pyrenochaeta sp. MPI-SDFR-AT-0127]|nr:hypothetical protein BKA66DRAFT_419427 [Pyrenochaeta sp. MPI-SDFR-AT-0127]
MAITNIQFLNYDPDLPDTTPTDHAHIVDIGAVGSSRAMIQDAVVTVLYQITCAYLDYFLDPKITSFRLLRKYKIYNHIDGLLIMRREDKMLVGRVYEITESNTLAFSCLVRHTIETTGRWVMTEVSRDEEFEVDWDKVWEGETVKNSGDLGSKKATVTIDPHDIWLDIPVELTYDIFESRWWDDGRFESDCITA